VFVIYVDHVVGIGGFAVSNGQQDIIKTFALSTCVGLVFYSMRKRCMGLSHIQLPNSQSMRMDDMLSRYADAAPGHLMQEMQRQFGVSKNELLISLYGGIDGRDASDCVRIGEKNLAAVKLAMRSLGLVYSDVDTGGNDSRTLVCYVSSGVVEVIKRPMTMRGVSSPPRR
jgi:chemotaxis protein CheD